MNTQLQRKFDELEAKKAAFLQLISTATQEQRLYKPTEKAWCMLQVGHHALLAEAGAANFMLTRQPMNVSRWQKIKSRMNSLMLTVFLKSPLKFKAPKVVLPPAEEQLLPLEQLEIQWAEARQQLLQYLGNFDETKLSYSVFKHPFVGPLTIAQTLDFMTEHISHHIPQLERLKR